MQGADFMLPRSIRDAFLFVASLFAENHDQAGAPYLHHLVRTMLRLGPAASDDERIAALLHDVIEDTTFTAAQLLALGYSQQQIAIVTAVSNLKKLPYPLFIASVVESNLPGAIRVKYADLADNSDPARLAGLSSKVSGRLADKYGPAETTLRQQLPPEFREQMILGVFDHQRAFFSWNELVADSDYPLLTVLEMR